jgi:hypothetical protein
MSRTNSKELIINKRRTYSSDSITSRYSRSWSIGSVESIFMDDDIIPNIKSISKKNKIIDDVKQRRIRDVYLDLDLEYIQKSPNPSYFKQLFKIDCLIKKKIINKKIILFIIIIV